MTNAKKWLSVILLSLLIFSCNNRKDDLDFAGGYPLTPNKNGLVTYRLGVSSDIKGKNRLSFSEGTDGAAYDFKWVAGDSITLFNSTTGSYVATFSWESGDGISTSHGEFITEGVPNLFGDMLQYTIVYPAYEKPGSSLSDWYNEVTDLLDNQTIESLSSPLSYLNTNYPMTGVTEYREGEKDGTQVYVFKNTTLDSQAAIISVNFVSGMGLPSGTVLKQLDVNTDNTHTTFYSMFFGENKEGVSWDGGDISIPILVDPMSAATQIEFILTNSANKTYYCTFISNPPSDIIVSKRYQFTPEWSTDSDAPAIVLPEFGEGTGLWQ